MFVTQMLNAPMNQFSQLLDVQAYDVPTGSFVCSSNYIGVVWQCEPLSFVNQDLEGQLKALLQLDLPDNTYLSFSLIADDNLTNYYQEYELIRLGKVSQEAIINSVQARLSFLKQMQLGNQNEQAPCSLRNYLVVVSLKLAYKGKLTANLLNDYQQYSAQVEAALIGCFGRCQRLDDRGYLFLMRNLLLEKDYAGIGQVDGRFHAYDEQRTIAQQIFAPSSSLELHKNCMQCGDQLIQVFTPLEIPNSFACGQSVTYIGDLLTGITPLTKKFLLTTNLFYGSQSSMKTMFENKRNWTIKQSMGPIARFIPRLTHTSHSFDIIEQDLDSGDKLVKLSWSLVAWVPDPQQSYAQVNSGKLPQAQAFAVKVKSYFQTIGWLIDNETTMQLPVLLNALPLNVDDAARNHLQRFRTMSTSQALVCLPLFAEWKASLQPIVPLISRTGQLMSIDLFASQTNFNCCIAAQSGSGKSFLVNEMVANLLATGAQCWIIDIGRSYKKLAEVYQGEFMEFSIDAQININPFHLIHDYSQDADMLFTLIQTMLSPKDLLSEYQANAVKQLIKDLWDQHGTSMTIDMLEQRLRASTDTRVQDLATHLFPYTSKGAYGIYFQNATTNIVDMLHNLEQQQGKNQKNSKSRLVVLELEELSGRKDLQQLVLLQLIFAINQQMVKGDRAVQKVLFIDEAWDLLASKTISYFIETGYRRFRKYNGAVVTITQSLEDLYNSSSGRAIASNSANYYFLAQKTETIKQLLSQDKLVLDGAAINQITSLRTRKGFYSEIFVMTDYGYGVGRLIVDPALQLLYSTNATDLAKLAQIQQEYQVSLWQAIEIYLQQQQKTAPYY